MKAIGRNACGSGVLERIAAVPTFSLVISAYGCSATHAARCRRAGWQAGNDIAALRRRGQEKRCARRLLAANGKAIGEGRGQNQILRRACCFEIVVHDDGVLKGALHDLIACCSPARPSDDLNTVYISFQLLQHCIIIVKHHCRQARGASIYPGSVWRKSRHVILLSQDVTHLALSNERAPRLFPWRPARLLAADRPVPVCARRRSVLLSSYFLFLPG